MNSLEVLDVTLRDGGCVNDFNFGREYMQKILFAQEKSGLDIIELGYLDEKNGSEMDRTQYINESIITKSILKNKQSNTKYVVMMDYGKFNVDNLSNRKKKSIDGIRVAFHKKDRYKIIDIGKKIMEKGYELYIQPMITLRYSDSELIEFIHLINNELPNAKGFYIVDSFGEMRPDDMSRVLNLVDHNLIKGMKLGFHSHNNLQMAYSNAISMLQFPTNRSLILDCSIMGMGKGAGNLNTELLLEHLNLYYGKDYRISPLLEVIDKVINQLHSEFYWGYAPEYYLSAINQCSPSYASYFYNRHMLPIDQVSELLNMISNDKKISFDKNYAEEIYLRFNEKKTINDNKSVNELKQQLNGMQILLIAPGRSILDNIDKIRKISERDDTLTIGLNTIIDFNDFVLATRKEIYDKAVNEGLNVIVCSNVSKGGRGNVKVLNYGNWISIDERTHDSSMVIAFNLIKVCNVKKIMLAGFDGFSININQNYYDLEMRRPVNQEQAFARNSYYKKLIEEIKNSGIEVDFITESLYQ